MRDHTQVQGFVMAYRAHYEGIPGGLLIPESFWCIDKFHIERSASIIQYWYLCWKSLEEYDQGFPAMQGLSKVYQIDRASGYEAAIQAVTQLPTGSLLTLELEGLLNANAMATKDVPVDDGEPVSFFETAQPAA